MERILSKNYLNSKWAPAAMARQYLSTVAKNISIMYNYVLSLNLNNLILNAFYTLGAP